MESTNKYRCVKLSRKCSSKLRNITLDEAALISEHFPAVSNIHHCRICASCHFKLKDAIKIADNQRSTETESEEVPTCSSYTKSLERNELVDNINKHVIPHLASHPSPMKRKYLERDAYCQKKTQQITQSISDSLGGGSLSTLSEDLKKIKAYYEQILENMKYQIENCSNNLDKQKILSLLPNTMTSKEIKDIFGHDLSYELIKISKDIQKNKTKFSDVKRSSMGRRSLPEQTLNTVKLFYEDDEISRIMPGSQDSIVVRQGNIREKVQKRLMLSSLRETYYEFRKIHPSLQIGFTKFTMLRPENCIKLGVGNQQNVCVCTLHQNVKLMFEKSGLKSMEGQHNFRNYKDVLKFVICNGDIENSECCVSMCGRCYDNLTNLRTMMLEYYEKNSIQEVIYKKWNTTLRCNLETISSTTNTFVDDFVQHINKLVSHHFTAKRQSRFVSERKMTLLPGELLIQMDFAENYAFVIQDSIQGYHWNNNQATIHPFVIYYKDNDNLIHRTFAIISDCNIHDSIAVHLYISKMINFVKTNISNSITKVIYVSDGAGAQYKNKYNLINLCHHKIDFEIFAEWHFYATSHGKSACDGIGGTLKRGARNYSMANKNQIQTAKDLYHWASQTYNTSIEVAYADADEYNKTKEELLSRYKNAKTITGTQSFHSFVPLDETSVKVSKYSESQQCELRKVVY